MQETPIKGHFTNSLLSEIWGLSKGIFYWDFWIINLLYYGKFLSLPRYIRGLVKQLKICLS